MKVVVECIILDSYHLLLLEVNNQHDLGIKLSELKKVDIKDITTDMNNKDNLHGLSYIKGLDSYINICIN